MKRLIVLLIALMMLLASASAEELLTLGEPLSGVLCWPEGSDESTANYVYRYSYPQVAGSGDVVDMINGFYAYEEYDTISNRAPMDAEIFDSDGTVQCYTNVTHEITCRNEHYLSVKITKESFLGTSFFTFVSAQVFSLDTGSITTLPYLLGILNQEDVADEWLETRQTNRADACVQGLIWEIIEQQIMSNEVAYYDDLDYELFCDAFSPEEGFYLDKDGNLVFFIQAGDIAPVAEGMFFFPFTLEELLDEI